MGTGTVTGDAPYAIAAAAPAEMPGATSSRCCKTQLQKPLFSVFFFVDSQMLLWL
jgi:hypothetical protein